MLAVRRMDETAETIAARVRVELAGMSDDALRARIQELLVSPYPVTRPWDYGAPGEYVCWTVLEHRPSNTGIAFCSEGFGPQAPWGLVWLEERPSSTMSMGMDCGWFPSLAEAMRDSAAWDESAT